MESALGRNRNTAKEILLALFSDEEVRHKEVTQVGTVLYIRLSGILG